MKSSTATYIIVLLAIINIAGLTYFTVQFQTYLSTSVTGGEVDTQTINQGYPDEVADLEQFLEQEKSGRTVIDQPISEAIGYEQCRQLLSQCRNRCQTRHDAGATVSEVDTCYADCETGFRFCGQ